MARKPDKDASQGHRGKGHLPEKLCAAQQFVSAWPGGMFLGGRSRH